METEPIALWFENWTKLKIRIHISGRTLYFREREIWWTALGVNIGFEQNGKNAMYERPVLILSKFNKNMFLGLPLTTRNKTGKYYFNLSSERQKSFALLSQVRLLSSKRLLRRTGFLSLEQFLEIKENFKKII